MRISEHRIVLPVVLRPTAEKVEVSLDLHLGHMASTLASRIFKWKMKSTYF